MMMTKRQTAILMSFLIIGLSMVLGQQWQAAADEAGTAGPAQIVVRLDTAVSIDDINADYGTSTVRSLPNSDTVYLLQVGPEHDPVVVIEALLEDARLVYAEPNLRSTIPEGNTRDIYGWGNTRDIYGWGNTRDIYGWGNTRDIYGWPYDEGSADFSIQEAEETLDPLQLFHWQMGSFDQAHYYQQPSVQQTHLAAGQAYSQGAGVVVAVLDTGVDLTHPLLAAHLTAVRYDFVDNNLDPQDEFSGQDHNGDGYVDSVAGHGTHIAGIIHRVAPQAQIMPLRVLNSDGQGYTFVLAEAMLFAADNGANVINLSLGTAEPSALLLDVVDQLTAQGVVVVAAAGNLNENWPQFPAAADCVLAVTAVSQGLLKADFANYGEWVDIAAPGHQIYSTYPGGQFAWWSGTSMATPFVAGQVALLLSADSTLSLADVGRYIGGTAVALDNANPDYSGQLGYGRIHFGDSLQAVTTGNLPAAGPLDNCQ
jgi:subtilisin family serine protease